MGKGVRTVSWILALLLISATTVTPVLAEEQGFFGKLKLAMDYLKDPGLLIAYIKNEIINPLLHKDPYSRYKEIVKKSGATPTSEPEYMKKVREKLNGYFARLNGYNLTADQLEAICKMGVSDVTLAVMDSQRTYYIKHIYVSGDVVKVDGRATPNMVSITPRAAYELVLMLDDYLEDGSLSNSELKSLGNWGLQKYKSGEISGKKSHIEAVLNFLLSGGGEG
ncbi:hypothetical protein [Archaeoglobus profundus]|uniref:Uncharacterized protein n=1 Tax=Archaeoglobus profundus (strain DSM 5631 / JCM 9629 / NBRC 100127 / Av18) TaxID=572546 RepID=D2RHY4_ARCPA|nr:hypothetical protein [Archaeoglobus profundus]ADB57909.1 hypothetical protein Arcpr_0846 [Archaeoglobus profundus DSM 5631]